MPVSGFVLYCILCPSLPFLFAASKLGDVTQFTALATYQPLLFSSYKQELWYFEILGLVHRLVLTAVLPAFPGSRLQLWCGLTASRA